MNTFLYLIRRELWEHRSIFIAPLVFLGVITVASSVGLLQGMAYPGVSEGLDAFSKHGAKMADKEHVGVALGAMALGMWMLFHAVGLVVGVFYLLDALYADRKDRSIMFWKSLPIGDTATVLSKLTTGVLVIPAVALVASLVALVVLLIIVSIAVLIHGGNPLTLIWLQFPYLAAALKLPALTLMHALWFLPLSAWLLLSSASTPKLPMLFAILVPAAIIFAEGLAFHTGHFAEMVGGYFGRYYESSTSMGNDFNVSIDQYGISNGSNLADVIAPFGTLTDPVFYIGLTIAALFVAASIYMRQRRVDAG